ncbi:nuclear transport factor 2 family protein [Seohaeicola saemankumensis]|nr:adenylate/guanylate cyclase domain-containing protein [Seohaeicola saemankumensis]MCA0869570.1 nuclear transport factor 2 family protein [Seohaeicola saemankumensis]
MTRPSPELLAVARRWTRSLIERKDGQLRHFLSRTDALRFIGSAEGETWSGAAVREAVDAHFDELPTVLEYEEVFAEAHEKDGVGWTFFINRFRFDTRPEPILFHATMVFVLEDNIWKIVQRHASIPAPNRDTTGVEHTAIQALVSAAQQGFLLGQREGLASVMFTDLVASATLAGAVGDRAWSGIVSAHFTRLRGIIEDHGGQFVKSLGDGTMSSFSSARAALAAARAIQEDVNAQQAEPRLSLRIGIHTGDVVQSDDDFFGSVVNKAARITALAKSDTILVSDVTRAMVGSGPEHEFSAPILASLKGFEGEHVVFRLDWRA